MSSAEACKMIDELCRRLKSAGCVISDGLPGVDAENRVLMASKTTFSWKGFVFLSQHVVVREISEPKVQDVQQLFDIGFAAAKKVNCVPLLRGMQFGYVVIPVIVAEVVSPEVRHYVCQAPLNRWCLLELPVICNIRTEETWYFKRTNLWGALFFSDLRRLIHQFVK